MSAQVLVIDDDPAIVRLVSSVLQREGHGFQSAGSAAQARPLLLQRRYDLILLDYHLPDVTGDQLLEAISRHPNQAGVPVLVITGETSPKLANELRQHGAAGTLIKPFPVNALSQRVDKILSQRRAAG